MTNGGVATDYYVKINMLESNFMISMIPKMANLLVQIRSTKRSFYSQKHIKSFTSNQTQLVVATNPQHYLKRPMSDVVATTKSNISKQAQEKPAAQISK